MSLGSNLVWPRYERESPYASGGGERACEFAQHRARALTNVLLRLCTVRQWYSAPCLPKPKPPPLPPPPSPLQRRQERETRSISLIGSLSCRPSAHRVLLGTGAIMMPEMLWRGGDGAETLGDSRCVSCVSQVHCYNATTEDGGGGG